MATNHESGRLRALIIGDIAVLYLLAMRGFVFLLAGLLVTSLIGGAQNPNCVSVRESGDDVTLRAESWDPVLAIGRTLADRYGINVSVEAPKWAFPGDTQDVAADPTFSEQHGNIHYDVMKRHVIEVRFSTSGSGHPNDAPRLLRQVADAANREMPYAYRLDEHANWQASSQHPNYDHWVVSCDGTGAPWCFIEVVGKFSSECL